MRCDLFFQKTRIYLDKLLGDYFLAEKHCKNQQTLRKPSRIIIYVTCFPSLHISPFPPLYVLSMTDFPRRRVTSPIGKRIHRAIVTICIPPIAAPSLPSRRGAARATLLDDLHNIIFSVDGWRSPLFHNDRLPSSLLARAAALLRHAAARPARAPRRTRSTHHCFLLVKIAGAVDAGIDEPQKDQEAGDSSNHHPNHGARCWAAVHARISGGEDVRIHRGLLPADQRRDRLNQGLERAP